MHAFEQVLATAQAGAPVGGDAAVPGAVAVGQVLSADQRAVLLLRIVGDLSIEQTAAALGKRAGAVKQLQRRGLEALRRHLERQGVTR